MEFKHPLFYVLRPLVYLKVLDNHFYFSVLSTLLDPTLFPPVRSNFKNSVQCTLLFLDN